jgi:CheY-like chemotaxis protein
MLNHKDLKWITATSTELNTMLQQISRYADLARQHKGEYNYIEMLGERVELATKTAQALFDRITTSILAGRPGAAPTPKILTASPFTVVEAAAPSVAAISKAMAKVTQDGKADSTPIELAAVAPIPADIAILNPKGSRELILLVDDEEEISTLASTILAAEGYQVILAKDGFEALKIYRQMGKRIGLVILDFFLPVMDGDVVFDELRVLNPDINVVLSSGFAEQTKLGSMLACGLRGFIPKPYSREKLLEQVRVTLDAERHAVR